MTANECDLHVACFPTVANDTDVSFVAERLSPPSSDHWVLYLTTDQSAVDIRRVVPQAIGHSLDATGALGFIFPSKVTTVHVEVAVMGELSQQWRFWLDDEPDADEDPN